MRRLAAELGLDGPGVLFRIPAEQSGNGPVAALELDAPLVLQGLGQAAASSPVSSPGG